MILIWSILGLAAGIGLGYFMGDKTGTDTGRVMLSVHLAIALGFVGLWLGVVFNKKATHHEECRGPVQDSANNDA